MATPLDNNIVVNDGVIDAILIGIVQLLQAHPMLSKAKILHEDDGDLENEIESGLSNNGLNIIVLTPAGESQSPDAPIVIIDDLLVAIRIWEVPIINRSASGTLLTINKTTEIIASYLHLKILGDSALVFKRWRPVSSEEGLVRDVFFQTSTAFNASTI